MGLAIGTKLVMAVEPGQNHFFRGSPGLCPEEQDVKIKDGFPWGVNLGAVLKAILVQNRGYSEEHRQPAGPQGGAIWFTDNVITWNDGKQATVHVRGPNGLGGEALAQTIQRSDIGTRLIVPDLDWGDVLAIGFAKAGWPTLPGPDYPGALDSITVPDLFQALTGVEPETIWKAGKSNHENGDKWSEEILSKYIDMRTPLVLQTKEDYEASDDRLKPKYAYNLIFVDSVPHVQDPSAGDDRDCFQKVPDQLYKDTAYIFGLKDAYELKRTK